MSSAPFEYEEARPLFDCGYWAGYHRCQLPRLAICFQRLSRRFRKLCWPCYSGCTGLWAAPSAGASWATQNCSRSGRSPREYSSELWSCGMHDAKSNTEFVSELDQRDFQVSLNPTARRLSAGGKISICWYFRRTHLCQEDHPPLRRAMSTIERFSSSMCGHEERAVHHLSTLNRSDEADACMNTELRMMMG